MKPDVTYGMYAASVPGLDNAQQESVPTIEEDLAHLEGPTSGHGGVDGVEQGNGWAAQQRRRPFQRGWKPSPQLSHQVLSIGDGVLVLSLVALAIALFSSLPSMQQLVSDSLSLKHATIIWGFLGLVSWMLAINIAQPKYLGYVASRLKSPLCALLALGIMSVFWAIFSKLFLSMDIPSSATLEFSFLLLAVPVLILWRFLFAQVIGSLRFRPLAAIVGINAAGEALVKELQSARRPYVRIAGYVGETGEEISYPKGLPILERGTLRSLINTRAIDMLIVAQEQNADPELFKEVIEANQFGIRVLPMTVAYENYTGKIPVEHVNNHWYFMLPVERAVSPIYACWKTTLDFLFGLVGFLLLCVVTPIIALLIALDSPGPIFYSQERVGLRGKPFRIYKFRSMRTDAEIKGQPIWAQAGDSRVTRVGRFLRATHLDELPQLFNILRGDMSLVGPRPERVAFVTALEKKVPFYRQRMAVKPGLTGWAQVEYHYGNSDNDALIKLQYDLYYIKHQSFILDVIIILKTVTEVLSLRGT